MIMWESLGAWIDNPHRYEWTPPPRPASEYEAVVQAVMGLHDAGKIDRAMASGIIQILLGAMLQDHVRQVFGETGASRSGWFLNAPAEKTAR